MEYTNIAYINEMYWLIMQLSYYIRHSNNKINEINVEEMLSLTLDLLNLLEQYLNDKYYY